MITSSLDFQDMRPPHPGGCWSRVLLPTVPSNPYGCPVKLFKPICNNGYFVTFLPCFGFRFSTSPASTAGRKPRSKIEIFFDFDFRLGQIKCEDPPSVWVKRFNLKRRREIGGQHENIGCGQPGCTIFIHTPAALLLCFFPNGLGGQF